MRIYIKHDKIRTNTLIINSHHKLNKEALSVIIIVLLARVLILKVV